MDQNLVYAKTPIGEDAVRQSTRVVQRNLRMVLVQVDGSLSVAELAAKIGNAQLVESALRELEAGGLITPLREAALAQQEGRRRPPQPRVSAVSQLSSFGSKPGAAPEPVTSDAPASAFSSFGKPILPANLDDMPPEVPPPAERGREPRRDGQPFPVKRLLVSLAVLVFVLLAAVLFFPYERFRPDIESVLGDALHTKVRIGAVRLGLSPRPQLLLSDIRLGEGGEGRIGQIRLPSPFALLRSGRAALTEAELVDLSIAADQLAGFSEVAGGAALRRLSIERMTVVAGDLSIRELSGEILLQGNGKVEKASLQTVDRSLRLQAAPTPQGVLLNIEAYGWRPASDTAIAFDAMQAKGLLQRGKLLIQDLDTTVLGGVVKGNWLIDWSKGLVMAGEATLARLDLKRIATVFAPSLQLEGELAGQLRLRGAGQDWEALWSNAEASLEATVSRGIFHGVDLGEATRRGAGSVVRSGSTKFETLRADVTLSPGQLRAEHLRLDAGPMSATGQVSCGRDRQIEGSFVVTMQSSVATLQVPVKVSGTLPDLVAVSGR